MMKDKWLQFPPANTTTKREDALCQYSYSNMLCQQRNTQCQVAARKPCDIICGRFRKPPTTVVCVSTRTQLTTFTCPEFPSTFKAQWLLYVQPGSTVQNSTFCLYLDLRTNSDYFPIQH